MKSFRRILCSIVFALALTPLLAQATTASTSQSGFVSTITNLLKTGIPETDASMELLRMLLGTTIDHPFTVGTTPSAYSSGDNASASCGGTACPTQGTLLAKMFWQFNVFIFAIAMIWFTYTAISGLAATMHEGVILGKRMSTVWLPIRVAFGTASLMPIFGGGWALCQVIMMLSTTLGIAGANMLTTVAIKEMAVGNTLVNPLLSIKQQFQAQGLESKIIVGTQCLRRANETLLQKQKDMSTAENPGSSEFPSAGDARLTNLCSVSTNGAATNVAYVKGPQQDGLHFPSASGSDVIPPPSNTGGSTTSITQQAYNIVQGTGLYDDTADNNPDGADVPTADQLQYCVSVQSGAAAGATSTAASPSLVTISFPNEMADPSGCGAIQLKFNPMNNSSYVGSNASFGYRAAGIDYETIKNSAMAAHAASMQAVANKAIVINFGASPKADQTCSTSTTSANGGVTCQDINGGATSAASGYDSEGSAITLINGGYKDSYGTEIQWAIAQVFGSSKTSGLIGKSGDAATSIASDTSACKWNATQQTSSTPDTGAVGQTIKKDLLNHMMCGGWGTLGIWYGIFNGVNDAIGEMLDPVMVWSAPGPADTMAGGNGDEMAGLNGLMHKARAMVEIGNGTWPTSTGGNVDAVNAVGEQSLGQALLGQALKTTVGASGTTAPGGGNSPMQMINLVSAFKNIGDAGIGISLAMVSLSAVMDAANLAVNGQDDQEKKVNSAFKNSPAIGKISAVISNLATGLGSAAATLGWMLFAASCFMAFYIPAIPFITWFASMTQWLMNFLESLVGSSLWALSHFDSEGEGLGQRTHYGWLYALNNFARPMIMVFAFFFASGVIIVMGSYLYHYFGNAVAAMQGNSNTGFLAIIAYLVIFCTMGVGLINTSFTLVLHLADKIMAWLGGQSSSPFGQQLEQHVNSVFMSAGQSPQRLGLGGRSSPAASAGPHVQAGSAQNSIQSGH